MKQSNIKWIQPNMYNWEELSKLVAEVKAVTKSYDQPYLGWISEQYQEDGMVREYGVVPDDDTNRNVPFMYNLPELEAILEHHHLVVTGEFQVSAPDAGVAVVASITNEWHKRGDVGIVIEDRTDYWPASFGVKWERTGKISYVTQHEVMVVTVT